MRGRGNRTGTARVVAGVGSLAFGLSLGACTVGPDFETPASPSVASYLPEGVKKSSESVGKLKFDFGAHLPGEWWEVFGNAKLNDLIEKGLKHNYDLKAAEAALEVAEHNALAARGAFWPTLQGNWQSSRTLTPDRTLQSAHAKGKASYTLHTPQVTVAYVVDVFGGVRRQVESAEAMVEAQQMQREAVALTLTSNIALATIQQASFEEQINATQRLIAAQTQLLGILRRQHEAGQIALPDVLAQETALAQSKLLLPPLDKQRDQQRNLLAVLTGRFPGETHRITFKLASFKTPSHLPVSVPADLVRQRPDIRAAEANLKQANAQIGVAIAARFPQFNITGNAGSTADAIAKLFSPSTWALLIAGSITQPIFDGRTLENKQKAAEAAFEQQTAQYRQVVLQGFQNVADTLLALDSDTRMIAAATAAEEAAKRSYDLIRQLVEQGQVSAPQLLTSQQAYLQTTLARVQAQASRLADTVALYQALGGGWWKREKHDDHHEHSDKEHHGATHADVRLHPAVRSIVHRVLGRSEE